MSKQQAIKKLIVLGWSVVEDKPASRFSAWLMAPDGQVGYFDPKDLLTELEGAK